MSEPEPFSEHEPRPDRIWTVPNVISMIRLLCLPIFLYVLFGRDNAAAAAWLLGGLGATDWVDGYIARHYNQVSELGKILDPVADRLLFFVGITAILIYDAVPVWFAVAVLIREIAVALGTLFLAARGAKRIDVTWYGKAGTFCLMFAFPLFLGAHSTVSWHETANMLAWISGIPGLVLSYYAAFMYIPIGRRALAEGRAARHAQVVAT